MIGAFQEVMTVGAPAIRSQPTGSTPKPWPDPLAERLPVGWSRQ